MFPSTKLVFASLSTILFGISCWAQQAITGATVSGQVDDQSGAAIHSASVLATNTATNQRWKTSADNGRFRFALLPPGSYEILVVAESFAPARQRLTLAAGQAFDIHLRLLPAAGAETVTVAADAALIETARTQASEQVNIHEIQSLPLNGRNYLDLALLVPGVSRTNTGGNQRFAETSAVPGTGISISSQRNLNNSFLVDGLSANDDAAELAGTFFSQEVIREFQVVTAGGIAEFGRASGGVVNITTKNGTNQLHGDVYGFLRSQRLDASNPLSRTKLPLTQAQYGTSLGMPLVKDKTFLFANFEQMRQNSTGVITISPANASAINNRLLAVGYNGPPISTGEFPTALDTSNLFLRMDHAVTRADQLTLRCSFYDVESTNARNIGGLNAVSRGAGLTNIDHTVAINNVWTISPWWLQETRVQFTRSRLSAPGNDLTGPAVNISGVASFGTATFSPTGRNINLFEFATSFSHQAGRHSLKAGVDLLHDGVRIDFPGAIQGVYSFSSMANFLNGNYINFQQAFGEPTTRQSNPNLGLFLQGEIHLRSNLVWNAGIRYDLQFLPGPIATDVNNVSPRAGIAWDPWNDGKTVVRASYGLCYDRIPLRAVANALQRDGFQYRVALLSPTAAGAPVFPNVLADFPAGSLTGVTTMGPHIRSSYSQQANLQIERELFAGMSANLGYTHLRGTGLIMSRNVNVPTTRDTNVFNLGRPDPTIANNSQFQSIGDSWYDGMAFSLSRRPGKFGSVRVSYTYSKALDTSGNFFFSTPQDNFNIAGERGRSDNDQRHRLAVSGSIDSGRGGSGWLAVLERGWSLSYVYAYTSALPFNIQTGSDINGDTNSNDRPAGVGRNTGEGFDFHSLDLRLARSLRLGERVQLAPSVDAFNVLNHRNNLAPNNVFGNGVYPGSPRPGFGSPTAVTDPRQVQLGLRLEF